MDNEEKLQIFLATTGSEKIDEAWNILEQNDWDVDTAVNFYFTTLDDPQASSSSKAYSNSPPKSSSPPPVMYDDEDFVRAPIQSKMDTLVDYQEPIARPSRYQKPTNAFEAFRDFEKERGINKDLNLTGKQKTLAELFKPPLDILTFGSFTEVKQIAEKREQWVLVNIQDVSEFDCQKLNRDTWSDKKVKEFISENFVFWQVNNQNTEGKWFIQYYPVAVFPFIAIIDPRTGQMMKSTTGFVEGEDMLYYLQAFISANGYNGEKSMKKQKKYVTEEEELEMAIQLSLKQDEKKKNSPPITPPQTTTTTTTNNNNNNNDNDNDKKEDDDDQDFDEDDKYNVEDEDEDVYNKIIEEEKAKIKMIKEASEDPKIDSKIGLEGDCSIQIRCPSETIKGNFNSTDKIQVLYYFAQLKTGLTNFKLCTSFPKVELSGDLMFKTLKEMDLAPRAVLMLQQQ